MHYLVEVEDTENNNGERGASMFRTESDLSLGGDVIGGSIQNGKGAKVDIDADYPTVGRSKRSGSKWQKCLKNHRPECKWLCKASRRSDKKICRSDCQKRIPSICTYNYRLKCRSKCRPKCQSKCRSKCRSKCCLEKKLAEELLILNILVKFVNM